METNKKTKPVFIIGAPRSATSAMVWALGQHPNIQPMPETAWIASYGVGAYLSYLKGSERERFSHLSNVDYPLEPFMRRVGESVDAIVRDVFAVRCERFYGDYRTTGVLSVNPRHPNPNLQILRSVDDAKQRWIDGTPMNSQFIWILAQMFPEARFIHNLRQPHEVVTSLEGFATVGADPQPLTQGLETWIQHTENAWFAERAFGNARVFRADFHRIAQEPEELLAEILEFLGEDFDPACLLPLKHRLNSSEVDARREETLQRLRDLRAFQTAEALYGQIVEKKVQRQPDVEAEAVLERRFLDYCHEKTLV
ncbi:hypothetical protein FKV24_012830 [Lysobacter maris]|uniref:Uncharacterized protein n=1 Tax=Marilutibacter maris TaxID=1605891 RepID=A0A508AK08_9GAMM|nr:sulfotransferase [Lysobacter maris]KAB8179310.1 hypothetical protein FKV24_012830 [Lysobacter maris]